MAFGAEELRVLRRALAVALHLRPARAEDVQDCLRLAESLDEAMREGARLRAFLVADLARYRDALPGSASGYFALLDEALGAGYLPVPDDLAALRALRGAPAAAALLRRCAGHGAVPAVPASRAPRGDLAPLAAVRMPAPGVPAARAAQDGGAGPGPAERPTPKPGERPAPAQPAPAQPAPARPARPAQPARPGPAPAPGGGKPARRPVPTPGEVFPRRRPAQPSPGSGQRLVARLAVV